MIYGYCRATTPKQIEQGFLKEQEDRISERYYGCKIIKETTLDMNFKPELGNLLSLIKEGDTLVVTKLDRFAKSVSDACEIIENLRSKNANIHILDTGLIDNSIAGDMILNVIISMNEFEKALLVERIQSGKNKAKKTNGFKEGRPKKYSQKQIEEALKMLDSYSYKKVEEMTGISKSTLIRAKKELSR